MDSSVRTAGSSEDSSFSARIRARLYRSAARTAAIVADDGREEAPVRFPDGMARPSRLRRACLVVPGSSGRMLDKARGVAVDQVVLDLEDAVAPDAKLRAREQVTAMLQGDDWTAPTRSVRINACDTSWTFRDLEALVLGAGARVHTVVVPKAEDPGDVRFVCRLLDQLELEAGLARGTVGLELQIESARGLVELQDLVSASDRLEALLFGPGDFAASLELPEVAIGDVQPDYPGDSWHFTRSKLLIHARNAGAQAIDGPYVRFDDPDGLDRVAGLAHACGFDGKWVIHPEQVDQVTAWFGTSQEAFDHACQLLTTYRDAAATGRGAISRDGEMVDAASARIAERIIARGRAQGLVPLEG